MRYLSLFSGVEAASVAWMRYGWKPLAFAEIDAFPSAVLANRFPDVPNLGDVRKVDWKEFYGEYGAVELLVGGSPCTSFSIAGNREGLEGESRLMFEYIRAIRDLVRASGGAYPRYVLWENVPGSLSSNKGRDFGCLLDALEDCGYGISWRTMDAQFARIRDGSPSGFFGPVAQRRRRVFLVGVLGSPNAAEILFERESLRGNHPPSREARKALARDAAESPGAGDSAGFKWYAGAKAGSIGYGIDTSPTIAVSDSHVPGVLTPHVGQPVISVSTANTNPNGSNINTEEVSYTLDGANSNAIAFAQNTRDEVRYIGGDGQVVGALAAQPGMKQTSYVMTDVTSRGAVEENMAGTITAHAAKNAPVLAHGFVGEYGGQTACGYTEDCSPTITAKHTPSAVAVDCRNLEMKEDVSGTLQAKENGGYSLNYQNPVMLKVRCGSDTYEKPDGKVGTAGKGALMSEDVTFTIAASQDQTLIEPTEYVVRRLTPVETERLQGFEDGWTDLTGCDAEGITRKVAEALGYEEGSKEYKKLQRDVSKWSKDCPDTPRYKAMGNSIATACLMWIGRRIEAFDILHYDEVGL